MSESIAELLDRIQIHLNHAEWHLAEELVHSLPSTSSISTDTQLQVDLLKTQLMIETKDLNQAEKNVNHLVNNIADWSKSNQIQILHVAGQFALAQKNSQLLEIYTQKFMDIYDSLSGVLKESNRAYYADMLDIKGQIEFSNQKYNQAMTLFENAVSLQKKLDRPLQLAISMFHAGKSANVLQLPNRSEVFLEDSYRTFKALKYIQGQHSVAQEFINTYRLKGDEQSVKTFQTISSELNEKLKLEEISRQKSTESDSLKIKNKELKQKIIDHQIQLESKKMEIEELNYRISELQQKVNDFSDIKSVYQSLKDTISKLEQKVEDQQDTINEQADLITSQHNQLMELKSAKPNSLSIDERKEKLEELIASSKLIESIHIRLNEIKEVKVRILAMQLRVSSSKCIEAVRQLEEINAVKVDSWENSNPVVTLLSI